MRLFLSFLLAGILGVLFGTATVGAVTTLMTGQGGTGTTTWSSGYIVYSGASNLTQSSNLFWDATNSRLGVGTAAPLSNFESMGTTTISGSATQYLQIWHAGNDAVFSDSVGSLVFDPVTSTYINGLQVGNLNWPIDGGEVSSLNMDLSALAATLPIGQSILGLNTDYFIRLYTSSSGSGAWDKSAVRLGIYPYMSWGGTNSMGGYNWHATTTQTTNATVYSISFPVQATGTMAFDCRVNTFDTGTASSAYYREEFLITRQGTSAARQVGATTEVAIEDVAGWGVAASSTATGVNLNLTGAASTNMNWKIVCGMLKIEP